MSTAPVPASSSTRLTELSTLIAQKTAQIEYYLDSKGLPLPSFDANAPVELGIARVDEDVQKIRIELLDLTKELRDLIAGPTDLVRFLTWDVSGYFRYSNRVSGYTMREGISALEREENISTPRTPSIPRS